MSHKRNEALRHVQHSMHHVIAAGEGSDRAPDSCKLCPYYRPDFKFRTCLYAHCPYKKQVNVFRSTPEKWDILYGAAHGTKCFTSGAVATAGDTIVLSYIDEFQFAGSDAGVVGVPNSDSDFGAGYAEGKVLMSKRVNADYYSKMMAEKAGSTVSLDANYDAIQNHVNGMSIADAEALSKDEKAVDAVSGATLVDTAGYVGVLVDAAK